MLGLLKKRFSGKKKRVVVLGIDGVPCSLLKRFIREDVMPNLAGLQEKGVLAPMTASIPEVSSTSWSTFMTGVNPGTHGIYGFMEVLRDSYKWKFPNFSDNRSETLWDIAGRNGGKSIVLNIPSTYPARELNGIMTAGFVALDLKKATYPESAYEYLKSIGYRMDVDASKARESLALFTHDIKNTFELRKRAILHFMDNHESDLFIGIVTETDRLHHYLWSALEDEGHPQHNFFIDFYRGLDGFIGEVYSRNGDDVPFIIVSDHGFTTIKKEVYLNSWLREKGYLKFNKEDPETFEDMNNESTAFALDPARIYIHRKGKYRDGCVDDKDYDALRKRIREELLELTINGEKIVNSVLNREEIYSGGCIDEAPDLVAQPYEGYDLKGPINKKELSGRGLLTGGHTRGNAVFYINRKVQVDDINIVDVGPTIISLLGIDERSFDGRCLI